MTKEERFVVNPLERYFLDPNRSGARWIIKNRPNHGRSATGWDLQVEHKNLVLLIEAKYIRGPFASALAGLTVAPLVYRPEKMEVDIYRSWSSIICWAIGCGYVGGKRDRKYKMSGVYQILFDCLILNLSFWRHYSKTLKVKRIYFVDKEKVANVNFTKILHLAARYKSLLDVYLGENKLREVRQKRFMTVYRRRWIPVHERRLIAEDLLKNISFK